MQGLSEDQVTQMMGIGYLGEVRQGPDGNLYQYVQGVDGLGNPIGGFWSRLKRIARSAVRKAMPLAQRFAPFIPGGAAALTVATPILKQAGVAGHEGIGALYQAPDGSLYQQVQGLADDEELRGLGEDAGHPDDGHRLSGRSAPGPGWESLSICAGGGWAGESYRRLLEQAEALLECGPQGAAHSPTICAIYSRRRCGAYSRDSISETGRRCGLSRPGRRRDSRLATMKNCWPA